MRIAVVGATDACCAAPPRRGLVGAPDGASLGDDWRWAAASAARRIAAAGLPPRLAGLDPFSAFLTRAAARRVCDPYGRCELIAP
jgi:hypothetical protein